MFCTEPTVYKSSAQHGPGTVMQCTETSDDLECYYKRLHYAPNNHTHTMFLLPGTPTNQTSDGIPSSDALPIHRKLHGKGAESDSEAQHRQLPFSREPMGGHGRMCTSSNVSPESKHHFFRRNTVYREQESSTSFEESFECNNDKKKYKPLSGQVEPSVKCDAPAVLDTTKVSELCEPNVPLQKASKINPCSYRDSYEDEEDGQSTQAKQYKTYIAHRHSRKNKQTATSSMDAKSGYDQFETDNLLLHPPKEESSLSSSSSSKSSLEESFKQKWSMFTNGGSKQDNFHQYIPKMHSYLSSNSADESNLDDSKSSIDSYKGNCVLSNTPVSSHRENTSAVFCSGFIGTITAIQNSGTCGSLNEEASNCKSNAPDDLQSPVKDTKHPQSAKEASSGHLSCQSANQETLDLNSALTERCMDSQSVKHCSWQRKKCDALSNNHQMTVRRHSSVKQPENSEENSAICYGESNSFNYRKDGKGSYPDKVHIVKQPVPNIATSYYRVIKPEGTSDVTESFSSHSNSSGHGNGTSDEELRGRCIAPGCFNEIMHTKSSLCIACYRFLQTSNDACSEYNMSLFAANSRLCKGPNCHEHGSIMLKGLCQLCFKKLSGLVLSKTDKKLTYAVSDPLKVKPHIRQDPTLPWNDYFATPLQRN